MNSPGEMFINSIDMLPPKSSTIGLSAATSDGAVHSVGLSKNPVRMLRNKDALKLIEWEGSSLRDGERLLEAELVSVVSAPTNFGTLESDRDTIDLFLSAGDNAGMKVNPFGNLYPVQVDKCVVAAFGEHID